MSNERGFALLTVVLLLASLARVVTELAVCLRLEVSLVDSCLALAGGDR